MLGTTLDCPPIVHVCTYTSRMPSIAGEQERASCNNQMLDLSELVSSVGPKLHVASPCHV